MAISRAEIEPAGSQPPPVNGEDLAQYNSSENHLIKLGETVLFSDSNSILSKIIRDAGDNSSLTKPEQPYSFTNQSEPDRDVIYPPGFKEEHTVWGN